MTVAMQTSRRSSKNAPVTRANGDQTKGKILNAAESLFGVQSFDTVSLRDITHHAEVTLALASYHFGTKENLFSAVVARRADLLNNARRKKLTDIEANNNLTIEAILDAFMRPLFEQMQSGDKGWEAYVLLISQLGQDDRWTHLLKENFDETANLFIDRLRPLLPKQSEEDLTRGFVFALQLMLQTVSKSRRIDSLSAGEYTADNLDKAYQLLLKFCVGGLLAL